MKKSLIALAVAAALPAFAQAQTNVQLYGIMDLGVGYKDIGGDTDGTMVVDSGFQSTSRWGIRGTEALGGGLNATFNLEAGISPDRGVADGDYWQRRAVVGLTGGWGELLVGRDYTVGFRAAGQTDIMGYSFFGNWLNFTAGATQGTGQAGANGVQTRASNGIFYNSPAFGNTKCMAAPAPECGAFSGGLTFTAMYATGEQTNPGSDEGDAYGAAAVYKGGPLILQGYWQRIVATAAALGVAGDVDVDQYGLGAGWNFGMFRLAANWGEAKLSSGSRDVKNKAWAIGGAVKLGPGELLLNYIDRQIDGLPGLDPDASTWGIAYTYPMSKRTNLYATYGMTNNGDDGAFRLNYSQSFYAPAGVGEDVIGFAVGIRHLF